MFCDEMLEQIEAIAGGDVAPDARMAAHLASCPNCRATLDRAREIERLMRARPAPEAPPHFTSRTLARIRRDKWRRDQSDLPSRPEAIRRLVERALSLGKSGR